MGENTAIRCVGGIVHDGPGTLLLIRRGRAPSAGLWSIPGGRVEIGESDADAVVRELCEETGLRVTPHTLAGTLTRGHYEIYDYLCSVDAGELRAGDDAADARWVSADTFDELDRAGALTEGLSEALRAWGALPR